MAITEDDTGNITGIEARTLGGWGQNAKKRVSSTLRTAAASFAAGVIVGMSIAGHMKDEHVPEKSPDAIESIQTHDDGRGYPRLKEYPGIERDRDGDI